LKDICSWKSLSRPWFPTLEGLSGAPPLLNQYRVVFTGTCPPVREKLHPYKTCDRKIGGDKTLPSPIH
jgi:hypothetical protein